MIEFVSAQPGYELWQFVNYSGEPVLDYVGPIVAWRMVVFKGGPDRCMAHPVVALTDVLGGGLVITKGHEVIGHSVDYDQCGSIGDSLAEFVRETGLKIERLSGVRARQLGVPNELIEVNP